MGSACCTSRDLGSVTRCCTWCALPRGTCSCCPVHRPTTNCLCVMRACSIGKLLRCSDARVFVTAAECAKRRTGLSTNQSVTCLASIHESAGTQVHKLTFTEGGGKCECVAVVACHQLQTPGLVSPMCNLDATRQLIRRLDMVHVHNRKQVLATLQCVASSCTCPSFTGMESPRVAVP